MNNHLLTPDSPTLSARFTFEGFDADEGQTTASPNVERMLRELYLDAQLPSPSWSKGGASFFDDIEDLDDASTGGIAAEKGDEKRLLENFGSSIEICSPVDNMSGDTSRCVEGANSNLLSVSREDYYKDFCLEDVKDYRKFSFGSVKKLLSPIVERKISTSDKTKVYSTEEAIAASKPPCSGPVSRTKRKIGNAGISNVLRQKSTSKEQLLVFDNERSSSNDIPHIGGMMKKLLISSSVDENQFRSIDPLDIERKISCDENLICKKGPKKSNLKGLFSPFLTRRSLTASPGGRVQEPSTGRHGRRAWSDSTSTESIKDISFKLSRECLDDTGVNSFWEDVCFTPRLDRYDLERTRMLRRKSSPEIAFDDEIWKKKEKKESKSEKKRKVSKQEKCSSLQNSRQNSVSSPSGKKKGTPKLERKRSTPKLERKKSTPKLERQKSTPKLERKKSTPKLERERSISKSEQKKSTPKLEHKKSSQKLEKRKSTPKLIHKLINSKLEDPDLRLEGKGAVAKVMRVQYDLQTPVEQEQRLRAVRAAETNLKRTFSSPELFRKSSLDTKRKASHSTPPIKRNLVDSDRKRDQKNVSGKVGRSRSNSRPKKHSRNFNSESTQLNEKKYSAESSPMTELRKKTSQRFSRRDWKSFDRCDGTRAELEAFIDQIYFLSKKSSFSKKKQNSKEADEEVEDLNRHVDPVYSLLKCAADLPRSGGKSPCMVHAHCSGQHQAGSSYARHPSGGDSSGNTSKASSPSSSASHSPKTRRKKLNARMKSFSLDTPEPPKQLLGIDETTKKKSSSFTNTCFGGRESPDEKTTFSASNLRKKFAFTKASSLEIEEKKPTRSYSPSPKQSPKSQRKEKTNLYVVLYNFKAKEKDDMDLRAGWRVNVTDSSKKDWWKGKSHGKSGYFPATYVIPIQSEQRVFQVLQPLNLSDGNYAIKFHKDQIVLQIGEEMDGMITIRAANNRQAVCPLQYLQEL